MASAAVADLTPSAAVADLHDVVLLCASITMVHLASCMWGSPSAY
jgi:hypothetical protein